MQMQISSQKFDPARTLLGRDNVIVHTPLPANTQAAGLGTPIALYMALDKLTRTKPQWMFHVTEIVGCAANEFTIYEDGEALGKVDIGWRGSRQYLRVSNTRIDRSYERATMMHTQDPEKAALCIRKNFYTKSLAERAEEARSTIKQALAVEHNSKVVVYNGTRSTALKFADTFAEQNSQQYLAQFPQAQKTYAKLPELKAGLLCVETIRKKFDTNKMLLVLLGGAGTNIYRVSQAGGGTAGFDTYTDDTLPEDLRTKIGMLKLLENKQTLSIAGFRLNDKVFAVLPPEEEQK